MRIFATFLAVMLSCAVLSAQGNNITPAPVRVQGGVCVDGQCGVPTPFDTSRTFKLYIKGADSADAVRLEAAVSAAGLEYERVNRIAKRDFKGAFIFINIFPESMEYDEGYAEFVEERDKAQQELEDAYPDFSGGSARPAKKAPAPVKSEGRMSDEVAAAIAMALDKESGSETYAAIGMALHQYLNDTVHDLESYIITIRRK